MASAAVKLSVVSGGTKLFSPLLKIKKEKYRNQ
jgi:hypothetical protein